MFVDHKNLHHKQRWYETYCSQYTQTTVKRPKAAAANSGDKIKKRIERPFGRRTEATNNTDVKIDTLCQMIKTILQG